jgi:hypothetical protein
MYITVPKPDTDNTTTAAMPIINPRTALAFALSGTTRRMFPVCIHTSMLKEN